MTTRVTIILTVVGVGSHAFVKALRSRRKPGIHAKPDAKRIQLRIDADDAGYEIFFPFGLANVSRLYRGLYGGCTGLVLGVYRGQDMLASH